MPKASKSTAKRVPPPPSYVEPVVLSQEEKVKLRNEAISRLTPGCFVRSLVTGRVGAYIKPCYDFAVPTVWVEWDIEVDVNYPTSENPLELEVIK